jgi:hypothetical protein
MHVHMMAHNGNYDTSGSVMMRRVIIRRAFFTTAYGLELWAMYYCLTQWHL